MSTWGDGFDGAGSEHIAERAKRRRERVYALQSAYRKYVGKLYRHHKGKRVLVVNVAFREEDKEILLIFHRDLQPTVHTAIPINEWEVIMPGGKQRFRLIDTVWEAEDRQPIHESERSDD